MKRIIIFLLLFAALKVAGQTTGYLRFDTVKIMKQNGTCELYIINKTKDSLGLLTNVGGGLTQFIKPKTLNDSTIIIGLDTLVVRGGVGSTTQRFGLEDNLATATRTFNADGYNLNFDSVGNHYVFSKVKAAGSGADAGLRGELRLSNGTINLWAYHSNNVSTRSYGFNAYPALTQMFAAGHVSGHAGYVQADTNQVILESDPYRFYLFHDSAMLGRMDGGTADVRIRTLPQTTDTSYKSLVSGPNGQLFLRPGDGGGGGGSALLDTLQSITSGSTATITDGTNIVYIDPASNLSSLAVTLPARPHPSNEITVYFGGTITSGSVVTTLSFVGNTGQTILQASSPSTVYAGDFAISYRFRTSNSKWYRKQ